MAWSTDFEEFMPLTVTMQTLSGLSTDGYAIPTYTTSTGIKARIVHQGRLVKNQEGIEELASTVMWLASTSTYAQSSKVTYPSASTTVTESPIRVEAYFDEDGVHHSRIYFG